MLEQGSQVCSWSPGGGDGRGGQRKGREQAVVGASDGLAIGPYSIIAAGIGHASSRLLASEIFPVTSHMTTAS